MGHSDMGPRERQLRELREARAKKANALQDAARGRDVEILKSKVAAIKPKPRKAKKKAKR